MSVFQDSTHIVKKHMRGRGVGTKRNSNRGLDSLTFNRPLEEMVNVTRPLLDKILTKYGDDFRKFGYDYSYAEGDVKVFCNGTNRCC